MTEKDKHILTNLRRAAIYHGLYTRVARKVGVTTAHARFVALGQRNSPRVMKELVKEIRKIEREADEGEAA